MNEIKSFSIAPQNFEQANSLAEIIAGSQFCPTAFKGKPGDVLCAIQFATEVGLQPMQGLQNIAVINGKPSLYGDAALAIVRQHPAFVSIEERDPTDALAKGEGLCSIKIRHSEGTTTVTRRFTTAEAKAAGLIGKQGPWSQYPGRMYQMRARAFAMRDALPEALKGIGIAEESSDIPAQATARALPQTQAPNVNALPAPSMPEAVDTRTGEVIEATAEPAQEKPAVAPLKVDDFADRFSECTTMEQVDAISKEIRAMNVDQATRAVLAKSFAAAKARVSGGGK